MKIVKNEAVDQGMITYENTKTFADLVRKAGEVHGDRVYLRYEKDDKIKEVTYRKIAESCGAIAGWAEAQNEKQGYTIRVGILGGSSYPYVSLLYGLAPFEERSMLQAMNLWYEELRKEHPGEDVIELNLSDLQ